MADIEIARIGTETLRVPIIGTMPLIVHNFSAKAKRQMLDAQQGRKTPKEARDPQAEYEAAFYRAWRCAARRGSRRRARQGSAWLGVARHGSHGAVRQGTAGPVGAWQASQGATRYGSARHGGAALGLARQARRGLDGGLLAAQRHRGVVQRPAVDS